jgi:hypothetical protein
MVEKDIIFGKMLNTKLKSFKSSLAYRNCIRNFIA